MTPAWLLFLLFAPAQDPLAHPLQDRFPPDRRAVLDELSARLEALGGPLEVVEVIPALEGRYGAFSDLDADGDLDYVATEMSHRREQVAIHLRGPRRWRRASLRNSEFRAKHPLVPWILSDDGSGRPAVVLPTGWPPYFYVFATDGQGRFRGEPLLLGDALPERLTSAGGVDDNPYTITRILPAGDGTARILGSMTDQDPFSDAARFAEWEIALTGDGPVGRHLTVPEPKSDVDWDAFPDVVRPFMRTSGCSHAHHVSSARRAIMATKRLDLDGDGVLDLVHFTGDFAAHVFLGVRDEESGKVGYPAELPVVHPLPVEDSVLWFGTALTTATEESGYATNALRIFERLDFTIELPDEGDARVVMYSHARHNFLVQYYWTGETLTPVPWYRVISPELQSPDQTGWWQGSRTILMEDWDDQGSLDTLVVAPFKATRLVSPREEGKPFSGEYRDLEPHRYALMYLEGDARENERHLLFLAPEATGVPENRHLGLPLELERVPVFEGSEIVAHRICLYYRPWKLGIFLAEPEREARPEADRARRLATWMRRGEQLMYADRFFQNCDRHILGGREDVCVSSGPPHPFGHERALWFFEQARRHASTDEEHAELAHRLARSYSRTRDLRRGLEAYQRYVDLTQTIEPVNSAHADLTWLFAQPRFRDWYAWRRTELLLRARDDQDAGDGKGRN